MLPSLAAAAVAACVQFSGSPAVSVIIDDLGYRDSADQATLELPAPLAVSILPFSPNGKTIAARAVATGHEVLLHLPMEAEQGNHLLGPGALTSQMQQPEFLKAVDHALASIPHVSGLNNHMGSMLTRDALRMSWLMEELHSRGDLFFVDSRTTSGSVAGRAARRAGVPVLNRDVFLDNERDADYINMQFDRLLERARVQGEAIGIAHPHAITTQVLSKRLHEMGDVRLVPVKEIFQRRACAQMARQTYGRRDPSANAKATPPSTPNAQTLNGSAPSLVPGAERNANSTAAQITLPTPIKAQTRR